MTEQTKFMAVYLEVCVGVWYVNSCSNECFAFELIHLFPSVDLMYLNGESLLRLSFRERRSLLKERFVVAPNKFDFVSSLEASGTQDDMEKVQSFFQSSIDRGCEGLMVKVLDHPEDTVATNSRDLLATYEPGIINGSSATKAMIWLNLSGIDKRVESWLKVKKDYIEGVGDSLDLVVSNGWEKKVLLATDIHIGNVNSPSVLGTAMEGRLDGIRQS